MYISVSRLRVEAARTDELVEAFRRRSHLVDDMDGFVDLEVWRSDRDPEDVWMVSRWRERSCFVAYMRSDEHARSHDRIPEDLDAAIALQRLEHMHTFDVVAE
jgi:heme-degrading monooxygenase HmoA